MAADGITTIIRGAAARHPEIVKTHDNIDEMTLRCEVSGGDATLAATITATLQSICKVRGRVALATPGELPNDGKVIADLRSYK